MPDFITLTCPSCGSKLQITEDIDRFACSACGNEHIVNRSGGVISLKPVIDSIKGIQLGVDRTASELALVRLKEEIRELEHDLSKVSSKKGCLSDNYVRFLLIILCLGGGIAIFTTTTTTAKIIGGILLLVGISLFILGLVIDRAARNMYKKQTNRINKKLQTKKKEMAIHQQNVGNG